jgi:hypothetical protein
MIWTHGRFHRFETLQKMKNLLKRLFGSRSPAPSSKAENPGFEASRMQEESPATIEDGSDNALRRQLVHVLLRDVLRRHGIPSALVECQMLVVSSRSRGPGMYVRLVLRQWDERLVRYAFAFQKALMADILRFEPQASEWLHGVSWQFEFGGSCPYLELPDQSFWQEPAAAIQQEVVSKQTSTTLSPTELAAAARQANAARRAALGSPEQRRGESAATDLLPLSTTPAELKKSEEAEDLERLFAIRDRELSRQSDAGMAPVGYEKTQPSSL